VERERIAGGIGAAVTALLLTACRATETGPPAIVLDATPCARCRMLVSDLNYAAAFRTAEGEEKVFDEIGCMLGELPVAGARVWVHDFDTSSWLDGEKAVFLRSESLETPMGGGIIAFSSREAAQKYGGEIATLRQLQEQKR
jgi:copper chaperone NosL